MMHFNVKYDTWWEQLYLFCKELTDQIQCSLSNNSKKKYGGTLNLNMVATSILRAKRAGKKLKHCRIVAFCDMRILVF